MTNLSVKYKSQWDSDAGGTNNDCGPCSIAQILNFYGENLRTNAVFEKTGAGKGLISWDQLIVAIKALGYIPHLERKQNLDRVRALIDAQTPPVILVHYGSLKSTQDKNFKGGHFFTPVGYNNDGFFVNDSDFKAPIREQGDHHNYLNDELNKAWADCTIDKNQPFSLLWIERKSATVDVDMSQPWLRQMFLEQSVDIDKPEGEIRGRVQEILDGYKKYPDLQNQVTDLQKQNAFQTGEAAKFEQESVQYAKSLSDVQRELEDVKRANILRDAEITKLNEVILSLQSQLDPNKVVVINKDEYIKLTSKNGLEAYTVRELIASALKRIIRKQGGA